jgi:RHS repeat-associated protein
MVGTPRLITDQNENLVARHDFIPFGEEIQNGVAGRNGNFGSASNVTQAFTGQESDGGTVQLDYFNARHLSAVLGGFVQPDPMNAGADITRPQSWNAYAYVLGNPLGLVDPSGMTTITKIPATIYGSYCNLDGLSSPCGLTGSLLANGSAAICPNNICGQFGTDSNGQTTYYQFSSYAGGLSGYVPFGLQPYEIQETAFGNTYTSYGNIISTGDSGTGWQGLDTLLVEVPNPAFLTRRQAVAKIRNGHPPLFRYNLTGTRYCGPGYKGGDPTSGLGQLCQQHDACYEQNGLSFIDNLGTMAHIGSSGVLNAVHACNQELCAGLPRINPANSQEAGNIFIVGAPFGCVP